MKIKANYVLVFIIILLIIFILFSAYKLGFINLIGSSFDNYDFGEFSFDGDFEVDEIATDLKVPWSIAFLDDDSLLVTERGGFVSQIDKAGIKKVVLDLSGTIVAKGESGLLGILLHPNFEDNKFVYLYHSYTGTDGVMKLKVARYTYSDEQFKFDKDILADIPAGNIHASGEIAFGPDGKLYITTGDAGKKELAQNTRSFAGKTLRVNDDGSIPSDNPFVGQENYRARIWSIGHRNSQGMDWHPETLEYYQSEHGPSGMDGGVGQDEINLVRRGQNYGWPEIMGDEVKSGMYKPLIHFTPAIAPSSIVFYDGDMFPELKNKLLVTALKGTSILILDIDGETATHVGNFVDDTYGRIREIQVAEDGSIYFTTSNQDGRGTPRDGDDKIYRAYRD